ncbi:hypothetical protein [Streptomyces sp. NPDC005209]|uniref:hypothetical protein n=1 Tax=Streptomyces sp. NPDC005209 TaxID=3156715 RepID=UPI0033A3AF78
MSEGIAWIGAHSTIDRSATLPGMLGGISLTAVRGVEADEFLINLGADLDELAARTAYRDLTAAVGGPPPGVNPVMYGQCGEWLYVLEDWGMATWSTGFRKVPSMRPGPGEEVVCVTMNWWSPPQAILHAPGDERVRRAEFGEDTGAGSALDAALNAAGAVLLAPQADEDAGTRLSEAVFTAVGTYCGLSISQGLVQAGELCGLFIPMV